MNRNKYILILVGLAVISIFVVFGLYYMTQKAVNQGTIESNYVEGETMKYLGMGGKIIGYLDLGTDFDTKGVVGILPIGTSSESRVDTLVFSKLVVLGLKKKKAHLLLRIQGDKVFGKDKEVLSIFKDAKRNEFEGVFKKEGEIWAWENGTDKNKGVGLQWNRNENRFLIFGTK